VVKVATFGVKRASDETFCPSPLSNIDRPMLKC